MTIRWLRCVLCGRPEDEATPSFSTYLHGVDSRCPECGKPQGADLVDRAAVESDLEDFDRLKDLILTLLPYAIDDGEDPPTEANAEECVEYAADEIARLRSKNAALRAAMTEAASVMESIYESFRDGESRGCGPDSAVRLIDPADVDIGIGCWLAKHHALRSEDRKAQTHEPWGLWLAKDAARRRADAEGPIPEWTCACGAAHKTRLHYCNVCALPAPPAPEKDGD